jgi:hypothetical protein
MRENMTPQEVPTFIFDDDGDFIPCVGTTLEDLILSAAKVTKIRVGSETGRNTRAMGNWRICSTRFADARATTISPISAARYPKPMTRCAGTHGCGS